MPSALPASIMALLPDGRAWPCALRVSARARKVRLKVDARGRAELTLPQHPRPNAEKAQDLLQSLGPWLQKTLTRLVGQASAPLSPLSVQVDLPSSISLPLLGMVWQVYTRQSPPPKAGQSDGGEGADRAEHATFPRKAAKTRLKAEDFGAGQGRLLLVGHCQSPDFVPACCELLQKWLRKQAQLCLPQRLRLLAERMQVDVREVRVRSQRTRWGSCSSHGDISLNAVLALLPVALADHVLLHELCHRRHMNHSSRYRQYLQSHAPHWALHEKALNRAWKDLPAWAVPRAAE